MATKNIKIVRKIFLVLFLISCLFTSDIIVINFILKFINWTGLIVLVVLFTNRFLYDKQTKNN